MTGILEEVFEVLYGVPGVFESLIGLWWDFRWGLSGP